MTKPNEVRPDKAVGRDAMADVLFVAIAAITTLSLPAADEAKPKAKAKANATGAAKPKGKAKAKTKKSRR